MEAMVDVVMVSSPAAPALRTDSVPMEVCVCTQIVS